MLELDLKTTLKKSLEGAQKIAVLGVGSDLRADDIAGMLVAKKLKEKFRSNSKLPELKVFLGATAPENLTGEIKRFQPTHLIIIDSSDVGQEPGTIEVIDVREVGGISFSSHMMPLKVMVDYMLTSFSCTVTVLGIQPKVLEFGQCPSKEVTESVDQIVTAIADIVKELRKPAVA